VFILLLFLLLATASLHATETDHAAAVRRALAQKGNWAPTIEADESSTESDVKKIAQRAFRQTIPGYQATKADQWLRAGAAQDDINTAPSKGDAAYLGTNLTLYQIIDALTQKDESLQAANALSGTTPHEIASGFTEEENMNQFGGIPPQKLMRAARPLSKVAYGVSPFLHELHQTALGKRVGAKLPHSTFTQQNAAAKTLGAANLAGFALDTVHGMINQKNDRLTPEEAALLSYLNRREGVPTDITEYKKFMKSTAKARQIINVLGQAAIPMLLSLRSDKTPISFVGNAAGIADSALSILQRYRTRRLIKTIKEIAPTIQRELEHNPPTKNELEQNKQHGAMPFNFMGADTL